MIFDHARKASRALTPNERILATVCELRSELASGEWLGRVKANCLNELAAARFVLNEVGAMSVAGYISQTVAALRRARRERRPVLLSKLERDLTAAGPALDRLIAKFAQNLLDAGGGSPEDLRTTPLPAARTGRNHGSSWMRDAQPYSTAKGSRQGSSGA